MEAHGGEGYGGREEEKDFHHLKVLKCKQSWALSILFNLFNNKQDGAPLSKLMSFISNYFTIFSAIQQLRGVEV